MKRLSDYSFRLGLWRDAKLTAWRRRVAYWKGYRKPTLAEIEAMRDPHHNSWPRSYDASTDEYGFWLEVEENEHGDLSFIHLAYRQGRRAGSGCKLRYYGAHFLFHGGDLERMARIHRQNCEDEGE